MQSLTYVILEARSAVSKDARGLRVMSTFVLPDLGEGLQEAELVAWHVGEGDHVVADRPLVPVETEKAVVEVPSPQDGKIARLCVQPQGERVKVGGPLVEFEEGPRTDTGTIVGELAARRRSLCRRRRVARCGQRRRSALYGAAARGRSGPKCPRAAPAARSPAPMSSAPLARRPQPGRSSRSPACAARWPSTWPGLMRKSCRRRYPTRPMSRPGRRNSMSRSGWLAPSPLAAPPRPASTPGMTAAQWSGVS